LSPSKNTANYPSLSKKQVCKSSTIGFDRNFELLKRIGEILNFFGIKNGVACHQKLQQFLQN
jgi:hypothetical protein